MTMRPSWRPLVAYVVLALLTQTTGCKKCCEPMTKQPAGTSANDIIQEFPAPGPTQTAWRVQWAHATSRGLYITGAWFKRSPSEPWMRVLWDARVAEIFVPYHSGWPRYYDLTSFNFSLVQTSAADAGCCGTLLGTPPVAVKEVRSYGLAWKDDAAVHRGQELVIWGTLDAANYNYIMQYGFRDDGTITFRIGATARNLPGIEMESHMHNALWRVDVDLAGWTHDAVYLMRHIEPSGAATDALDTMSLVNGGVEGWADWSPLEFSMLHVMDTQRKNSQGRNIAYDLMPLRHGTARHQETFTQHDFWVTQYRYTEMSYDQVESYVSNTESIADSDVVLWHISPVHHQPRSEDGTETSGLWQGVALAMWGGFDLRPRNLFDETPLHPSP